jgi:biopolymer transport protein ExbB
MFAWFISGGVFMWPILLCSVFAMAIVLERVYVLWGRYRLNADSFMSQIIGYLEEKNFSRAVETCNVEAKHPLAAVVKSGLMKANEADKDIQRSMESALANAVPNITKRIPYLSMLANVATLLGLLGTIDGLIECFEAVKNADAAAKQEALSAGISVAMLTTYFGLTVAIPVIVSYTVLLSRQNDVLSAIELKAADLFNYLSARNRRMAKKKVG